MSLRSVTLRVPPQDVNTRDGQRAFPRWYVRIHDVRLGEIGGADGFALEGLEGSHFISRTP